MSYSVAPYTEGWREGYQAFVRRNFGPHAYQGKDSYLRWLYFDNPCGRGYGDFQLILQDDGEVAGCIHKLRWALADGKSVASIHNLMVDAEHRNGAGFLLLRAVLQAEKAFLVPGVVGKLSETYRKLGAQVLTSFWGMKFLLPNPVQFLRRWHRAPLSLAAIGQVFASLKPAGIELTFDFDDAMVVPLNRRAGGFGLSAALLRWRLFPHQGLGSIGLWTKDRRSCLFFVIGSRKNVPLARIFYTDFHDRAEAEALFRVAERLMRKLGIALLMVATGEEGFAAQAPSLGIRARAATPDTYFHSRGIWVEVGSNWPLMSDIGFEEAFAQTE